jgi:hypothetical protein
MDENGNIKAMESKTEAMFFPGADSTTSVEEATRDVELSDNTFIPSATQFRYLGSIITPDLLDDTEVKKRIITAKGAFARLSRVFGNRRLKMERKTQILKTFVLLALLYGCETWMVTEKIYKKLEVTYNDFLRSLLGYNRYQAHYVLKLTLEDIRAICGMPSLKNTIHLHRARWLQKVAKMTTDRMPKRLLNAWVQKPRAPHRPQMTIRDTWRKTLRDILGFGEQWKGDLADWICHRKERPRVECPSRNESRPGRRLLLRTIEDEATSLARQSRPEFLKKIVSQCRIKTAVG